MRTSNLSRITNTVLFISGPATLLLPPCVADAGIIFLPCGDHPVSFYGRPME